MDCYNGNTRKNTINIGISLSRMVAQGDKKYKTTKLNEIISAVCGLMNSGGGKLELYYPEENASRKIVDACIRMIEQRIGEMIGTVNLASKIHITEGIDIFVQECTDLITVNYNLCLPSKSQVKAIPATEPLEKVKKIMQRKSVMDGASIGSHTKQFVKGKNTVLVEGNKVQIKSIKAESSKCITLADRIVGKSNKFSSYISAFANHSGGHIYYGINDSGTVEGETVYQRDKNKIVREVEKTIVKMVWPLKPKKGVQWDIFFEPVIDDNDNPIQSTFVIVLYVAPCPGGVFTEEPESYHLVDGQVQRISFQKWSLISGILPSDDQSLSLSSRPPRVTWSSEDNRKIYRSLGGELSRYRNDNDMDSFNKLSVLARQRFPESDVELIIMSEQIVVAFKSYNFCTTKSLFRKFREMLGVCKDPSIFEVKLLQLMCVNQRAISAFSGDYEASYAIVQAGLQKMELVPLELETASVNMDASMTAILVSATKQREQDICYYRAAALQYMHLAAKAVNSFEDRQSQMPDLHQKLHIYKAWALLGCCVAGEVVKIAPSYQDIETAAGELSSVSESVLKGLFLTRFRKVQYHLAESDLFRRRSEALQEDTQNLRRAFECATLARALARKYQFDSMVDYANKRRADLTEKLVRHAFLTRGSRHSRTFLGFEF